MSIKQLLDQRRLPGLFGLALAFALLIGMVTPAQAVTFEKRITNDRDDVEENVSSGSLDTNDSTIDMVKESGNTQRIGLRFKDITVPQGATISTAYIHLTTKSTGTSSCSVTIYGEDTDSSNQFSGSGTVAGRTQTSASADWSSIPGWTNVNEIHQTPELKTIVQEIVDRGGWSSGNDMSFIIEGSGTRQFYSYRGSSSKAALLHIEYGATQALSVDTLNWSPTTGAAATSSTVNVTNSGGGAMFGYSITTSDTWITVSSSSGTTNGTFTISVAANNTGSARSGTVTVTATGVTGSPVTININQPAQTTTSSTSSISMNDYIDTPIFMNTSVTPNVLILLDNSGSMLCPAYWQRGSCNAGSSVNNIVDTDAGNYSTLTTYYGYFDSTKQYIYSSNKFVQSGTGDWNGNFLNWMTMRRIDVAKKVLIGGKANPRPVTQTDPHTLKGESSTSSWSFIKKHDRADGIANNLFPSAACPSSATTCYFGLENGSIYTDDDTAPFSTPIMTLNIWAEVDGEKAEGVIQSIMSQVRLGMEFFNSNDGGYIDQSIDDPRSGAVATDFITSLENLSPSTNTPLGEALHTATGYYALDPTTGGNGPRYFSSPANSYSTSGSNYDPYDFGSLGTQVPCCKSFVIVLTDGQATSDGSLPTSNVQGKDVKNYYNGATNGYLDDVALYAHTVNQRGDLDGNQTLDIYTVGMFGSGSDELISAAKAGGFEDSNGNNLPDDAITNEWDLKNNATGLYGPDGIPDNYFEAEDGTQLSNAINRAFSEILSKATSGTALSVLATSASGAGNIFQAYFLPRKTVSDSDGTARDLAWLGYMLSLNVDSTGHMRDVNDTCISFSFNEAESQTYIDFLTESNGVCTSTVSSSQTLTSFTNYNWEAGSQLLTMAPAARTIYTFQDGNENGLVDSGEFISFDSTAAATLQKYLRTGSVTEAENVVKWIRGEAVSGYRSRAIDADQWKLGDIVYSTPSIAGQPTEAYNLLYQDAGFADFFNNNKDRQTMVYVGANDGMLHAFNADTGEEMWGYVPYNLLPHLKWLTDPDYEHVNYVDLKMKVTDVNYGTATSPNWKTVLIGGMRLGGGEIDDEGYDVDSDGDTTTPTDMLRKWRSAYFCIDITDPSNPDLLWEFGHNLADFSAGANDLGFTLSYPAIAKVGDNWFAVVGTGTKVTYDTGGSPVGPNYDGESDQYAKVFVINLKDNIGVAAGGTMGTLATSPTKFQVAQDKSYMADPIAVDIDYSTENPVGVTGDTSYNIEAVYIGETYYKTTGGGSWEGRMNRIAINNDPDPGQWVMYDIYNTSSGQAITAAPSTATDKYGNLWVYFGTGKYYSGADKTDDTQQALYGIKDPCWNTTTLEWDATCFTTAVSASQLVDTTNAVVRSDQTITGVTGASSWDDLLSQINSNQGWMMEFPAQASGAPSERALNKPTILGGLVLTTSFIPNSDICGFSGTSYFYSIYYETGTAFYESTIGTDETDTTIVLRRSGSASQGLASAVAIHAGREEGAKAFIQMSTGEAASIDFTPALSIKSGVISWRDL